MARKVRRTRGAHKGWVHPLLGASRAPCYEVSPYMALLWREHVEWAFSGKDAEAYMRHANKVVPGFWDTFGQEIAWRLYAKDERAIPEEKRSPHTKQRASYHDFVSCSLEGWDDLRRACTGRADEAVKAAGIVLCRIASAIQYTQENADPEGEAQGEEALDGLTGGTGAGTQSGNGANALDGTPNQDTSNQRVSVQREAEQIEQRYALDTRADLKREIQAPADMRDHWIRHSSEMREVLRIAGRVQEVCSRLAEDKRSRRSVERSGYAPTSRVSGLVPSELARLSGVMGQGEQIMACKRLADGAGMGWDPKGKGEQGRGPLVIVVDCSGSMQDSRKMTWAKAISLGLARECARSGRRFHIVSYDSRYLGDWSTTGAPVEQSIEEIVTSMRPTGGTNWESGLLMALNVVEHAARMRKADIVHVTDGQPSHFEPEEIMARAKAIGCRIHGIAVGTASEVMIAPGSYLERCSHTVTAVSSVGDDTKAIETFVNALA